MKAKQHITGLVVAISAFSFCQCSSKPDHTDRATFTRADSLMDTYLALQDSIHKVWNVMINDDNKKIVAMRNLLHEIELTNSSDHETIRLYDERLDELSDLRYNQKTMANPEIIEEYDFASNAIVSELTSLAESKTEFNYNTTLQKMVDEILAADQRVNNYREQYDLIVLQFNEFLETNQTFLKETGEERALDKRPLFQMTSDSIE